MDKTEREVIEGLQKDFKQMKAGFRKLLKINAEAGRAGAANACMKNYGKIITLHGEASEDLQKHYPDDAGPFILGGGAGR